MEETPGAEGAGQEDPHRPNLPTSNPYPPHKESNSWGKNPKHSQEIKVKPKISWKNYKYIYDSIRMSWDWTHQ